MPISPRPTPREFKEGTTAILGECKVERLVSIRPDDFTLTDNIEEPGKDVWFLVRVYSPEVNTWLSQQMIGVPILFGGDKWFPLVSKKVDERLFFTISDRSPIGALDGLSVADKGLLAAAVSCYLDGKQVRVKETGKGWISWTSKQGNVLSMRYENNVEDERVVAPAVSEEIQVHIDLSELLRVAKGEPYQSLPISVTTIRKGGPTEVTGDADTGKGQ